jgi:hypothetical protein
MWALYAILRQGLFDGPSGVLFAILIVADFPFSTVAFGYMFSGGTDGTFAVIAWGVGGTLWWYLLGWSIEKLDAIPGVDRRVAEVLLAEIGPM